MRRTLAGFLLLVSAGLTGCGSLPGLPGSTKPTVAPTVAATATLAPSAVVPPRVMTMPPSMLPASATATPRPPAMPTVAPPAAPAPSVVATTGQVVTVTGTDMVNLRAMPTTESAAVTQIGPGEDATVMEASVPGTDGGPVWVHVSYKGQMGYVRSDLVSAPHAPMAMMAAMPTAAAMTSATAAASATPSPAP